MNVKLNQIRVISIRQALACTGCHATVFNKQAVAVATSLSYFEEIIV